MELLTIGHSNHSAEKFDALLAANNVTMLVDVRSKPRSRFAQFGQEALAWRMPKQGRRYLFGGTFLGGLGSVSVNSKIFIEKMDRLLQHINEGQRLAVMCSEGNPCECHRAGKLCRWLHEQRPDVKTIHILPNGTHVDARELQAQVKPIVQWKEFAWPSK